MRTLSRCKRVAQAQSKPWHLIPTLRRQHVGVHRARLTLGPVQGPRSHRRPLWPGKGTGQGQGSRKCHEHSGPSPPGQAVLPGEGMEPAGAGGKGQLLHKALLEQKSQPAAWGRARGQTGLPSSSAVLQLCSPAPIERALSSEQPLGCGVTLCLLPGGQNRYISVNSYFHRVAGGESLCVILDPEFPSSPITSYVGYGLSSPYK